MSAVHRLTANLDGQIELVCRAFSTRAFVVQGSGAGLSLPSGRVYKNYENMFKGQTAPSED